MRVRLLFGSTGFIINGGMARIFFLAGELSGDLIASHLATALREKRPDLSLSGVGSRRLAASGVRLVADSSTWGAIGFLEGVKSALRIRRQIQRLCDVLRQNPPDVFVPVDFPFLNLKMIRLARQVGARVAYLAAPVSWQWLGSRPLMRATPHPPLSKLLKMRGFVDIAFPLYPFAIPYYQEAGIPCEYLGHPEIARLCSLNRRWSEDTATDQVAIFPGSRIGEVRAHLPLILRAFRLWSDQGSTPLLRVSVAHPALRQVIRDLLRGISVEHAAHDLFLDGKIRIILDDSDSVELMMQSRLSVMVSGTIVHQAMAVGAPCIAIYRVPILLAEVTRSFLLNLPFYTLPNLLAGREICTELIQENLTAPRLAEALHFLWHNPVRRAQVSREMMNAADALCVPGGTARMAERILQWL